MGHNMRDVKTSTPQQSPLFVKLTGMPSRAEPIVSLILSYMQFTMYLAIFCSAY